MVTHVGQFASPGETILGKDHSIFPGGKGANQAYAAAKLGGTVSMVGQVGSDTHGDWLRSSLASAGVDVSLVTTAKATPSGMANITINYQGQNQIVIIPGANGTFSPALLEHCRNVIASAKLVLLQLEIPMETVEAAAQITKESGAVVILDPAPALPISDKLLANVDYLTPNESELAALCGTPPHDWTVEEMAQLAGQLPNRDRMKTIVKMGSKGALLATPKHNHFWTPFPVRAIDTTAAGDAFNAAFAVALAEGMPEDQAGRFATAAAACSVTKNGAQPSMPGRSEVNALLESRQE